MTYKVFNGDNIDVLKTLADNSIDAVVTDPPYGLSFMAKKWDVSVPSVETWKEVYRVLKPGGHLLAFFGSRTYHRGVVNIEDAGFEIRDQLMWLYGTGFPKSHDVSKGIDKTLKIPREVIGTYTLPGYGKSNVEHGTQNRNTTEFVKYSNDPVSEEAKQWQGWGTALKPAHEPIVLARKPLEGTVAANVLQYGTGAINIDECRPNERHPANVIHDGDIGPASKFFYCAKASVKDREEGLENFEEKHTASAEFRPNHMEKAEEGDSGNPYGRWTKRKNIHPTVKPTELMEYLIKLITPPGGTVLDPFMGSGSTGKACMKLQYEFIGIELDENYCEIAKARMDHILNKKTGLQKALDKPTK